MNTRVVFHIAIPLVLLLAIHSAIYGQELSPRSTVDGVYTLEQSKRGEGLYAAACATCHGTGLTGIDTSPPLTGPDFLANWKDMTIADLFERIRTSMPADDPGRLTRGEVVDILAYMLNVGRFPNGAAELPIGVGSLRTIRIVAPMP